MVPMAAQCIRKNAVARLGIPSLREAHSHLKPADRDSHTNILTAFGYFANPSKTWLVTKQGRFDEASNTFAGSASIYSADRVSELKKQPEAVTLLCH